MDQRKKVIWANRREKNTAIALVLAGLFGFLGAAYTGLRALLVVLLLNLATAFWLVIIAAAPTLEGVILAIILYTLPLIWIFLECWWWNQKVIKAQIQPVRKKIGGMPGMTIYIENYGKWWYFIDSTEAFLQENGSWGSEKKKFKSEEKAMEFWRSKFAIST